MAKRANHTFQPTSSPPLRYGNAAAERGRWAPMIEVTNGGE